MKPHCASLRHLSNQMGNLICPDYKHGLLPLLTSLPFSLLSHYSLPQADLSKDQSQRLRLRRSKLILAARRLRPKVTENEEKNEECIDHFLAIGCSHQRVGAIVDDKVPSDTSSLLRKTTVVIQH